MNPLSPEQQQDFQDRAKAFQEEWEPLYKNLKEKHQVELVYGVQTVPSPAGIFGLGVTESIGDTKHKPVPSPSEFVAKE